MLEQINNALPTTVQFTTGGTGATGLTVTVNVYKWNGASWSQIVTAGSATEVGDGFYSYQLASGSNTAEGLYLFVFVTTGTADLKKAGAGWAVQKAGIEDLDALISSRAAAGVTVTVSSPVATDGTLSVVHGDDYFAVDSRSIDFTLSGAPSLTGAAAKLSFRRSDRIVNDLEVVGSVLSATQLRFEPTAAQTLRLTPGATYAYDVQAILTGTSHVVTLQRGTATVLQDYSPP